MYGMPIAYKTVNFPKEAGHHPVRIEAVENPGLFFVQLKRHDAM